MAADPSKEAKSNDKDTAQSLKHGLFDKHQCEAVIFDMDGLMIDSEPFWSQAQIDSFAKVGINLTKEDTDETTGIRILDIVKLRYQVSPWDVDKLGITIEKLGDMILDRVIELVKEKGEPLPGLQQCIDYVKSKTVNNGDNSNDKNDKNSKNGNNISDSKDSNQNNGSNNGNRLKLAVCSSSATRLINAICKERLNYIFNDCFDYYMSAENLEYGKPHPSVYIECAKKLGVDPQNCLAFEDSLAGTLSAKAAMMRVISVPQDYPNHTIKFEIADKILGSLEEVNDKIWDEIWVER